MNFIKQFIQGVFSKDDTSPNKGCNGTERSEGFPKPNAEQNLDSLPTTTKLRNEVEDSLLTDEQYDNQFDDESVFYITKSLNTAQKISDNNAITPISTPETYTTSNRATPDYGYNSYIDDNLHSSEQTNNPLRMPDGQIDPYVFWLKDEKRYLFTEGRLILTEKSPTYAIPTDFCHNDSSQKKHRIMIYYDINKSFEKRFGYYDTSNCFCEVEYIPEFSYIY